MFRNNPKFREQFKVTVLTTTMREFYPYFVASNVRQQIVVLRLSHLNMLFKACGEIIIAAIVFLFIGRNYCSNYKATEMLLWRFGFKTFDVFKENLCFYSFRYKLNINRSLSKSEFPRRQIIVLLIRKSANPPSKTFQKYFISPVPSMDPVESQ